MYTTLTCLGWFHISGGGGGQKLNTKNYAGAEQSEWLSSNSVG